MKHLSYLNKFLWKYRWPYLIGFVFVALNNFFGAYVPEVVGQAIDFAAKGEPTKFLTIFNSGFNIKKGVLLAATIIIGLALLKGFFMLLMRLNIIVNSHRIVADLRDELYDHYQQLDQNFYKRNSTGDLMSRVTEDINNVRMYLGPALMYTVNLTLMFVFVIYRMLKADPALTFYTLLPLPILSISIYIVSSAINRKNLTIQRQLANLTTYAQETFSGIRVIKSYSKEGRFQNYFKDEAETYKKNTLSLARTEAFFFPLMLLLVGISTIIAVYVGGQHVAAGKISAGTIVQFIIYVGMLTWPVTSLGWVTSLVQRASASQERINEFLNTEPEIKDGPIGGVDLDGTVKFENVSFTYADSGIEALKNINLKITKGEKLAIVGRTGSGKTTLADLLLRVFEPTEGKILLNNHDIRTLELQSLRNYIGYVPQDVFLFSDTIEENITLGTDSSLDEISRYAEYASVAKDIERFPKKYKTMIGERGVMLSGGQKQRLSIARALQKDPKLLILDDALSAVDAETEKQILDHFDALLHNKTVIIITHRVFTLFDVDRIVVLEEGKVVEEGSHDELYEKNGLYRKLYELQKHGEKI